MAMPELECPVCLIVYERPVVLSCAHSVCSSCKDHLLKADAASNSFPCPLCRTDVRKNFHFQVNHNLVAVIDLFKRETEAWNKKQTEMSVREEKMQINFKFKMNKLHQENLAKDEKLGSLKAKLAKNESLLQQVVVNEARFEETVQNSVPTLSKKLLTISDRAFKCRSCSNYLLNPIRLRCQHLLCENCFDDVTINDIVTCPTCQLGDNSGEHPPLVVFKVDSMVKAYQNLRDTSIIANIPKTIQISDIAFSCQCCTQLLRNPIYLQPCSHVICVRYWHVVADVGTCPICQFPVEFDVESCTPTLDETIVAMVRAYCNVKIAMITFADNKSKRTETVACDKENENPRQEQVAAAPAPQALRSTKAQIFVRFIKSQKYKTAIFQMNLATATVGELMTSIFEREGMPVDYQRLSYGGKPLNGVERLLVDFNIQNESTINMCTPWK